MRIAITGSTGLVGSALVPFLTAGNNAVTHLVRAQSKQPSLGSSFVWDPLKGEVNTRALEGADAIIHLAGENIAAGRWNARRKTSIKESRLTSTRLLAKSLSQMPSPPRVFISASAIGYYGDRGEERLDESSSPGTGFLADVCREWEEATAPAASRGIRVVNLRIGMVLSPKGGALAKMLTPFRLGLGGVLGEGRQFMSWISIDDLIGIIYHALITESLQGPVNAVTPHPITNRDFTRILGSVLHRPTIAAVPAFAARLAFGEMADALLLSSTRVTPKRLLDSRYQFRYPDLESALKHLLGK